AAEGPEVGYKDLRVRNEKTLARIGLKEGAKQAGKVAVGAVIALAIAASIGHEREETDKIAGILATELQKGFRPQEGDILVTYTSGAGNSIEAGTLEAFENWMPGYRERASQEGSLAYQGLKASINDIYRQAADSHGIVHAKNVPIAIWLDAQ